VLVEFSGEALASDPLGLPEDTRRALETDGRTEILKVLNHDRPPRSILCVTRPVVGHSPPRSRAAAVSTSSVARSRCHAQLFGAALAGRGLDPEDRMVRRNSAKLFACRSCVHSGKEHADLPLPPVEV
jgi:hypothetical protein